MTTPTQPVIILVRPQLGENIGKAARGMLNFGLTELRLVAPRDGWPNPDAGPSAAGADQVLDGAEVYDDVEAAIADLQHVFAATVRERDMLKPAVTSNEAAPRMRAAIGKGEGVGILFGPERSGLTNDDVVLADTIWTAPVNPEFSSLNLAQAVVIAAYEWFVSSEPELPVSGDDSPPHVSPAARDEMHNLFHHIEGELDQRGYFRPEGRRATMIQTLRNLFQGARWSEQQVRTFRGVVKSLASRDWRKED